MTKDIFGADLHVGDLVVEHLPDGSSDLHLIDHFTEYPARFVGGGDHARRAFNADETWRATVADGEKFHLQIGD